MNQGLNKICMNQVSTLASRANHYELDWMTQSAPEKRAPLPIQVNKAIRESSETVASRLKSDAVQW